MIRLYNIADMDYFKDIVDNAKGSIFLKLKDGLDFDLTGDPDGIKVLSSMDISKDGIELHLTSKDDLSSLLDYAICA